MSLVDGHSGCTTCRRVHAQLYNFGYKWDKLGENLGMQQLPGMTTTVFCGVRLIVSLSIFVYPGFYETTGTIVC